MYRHVSKSDFKDAFKRIHFDNFSNEGLDVLYDYLEELDPESKLDVTAICCKFSEYENLADFQQDFGDKYTSIEDIEAKTTVIPLTGDSFIIIDFWALK